MVLLENKKDGNVEKQRRTKGLDQHMEVQLLGHV
jgi:hypothetical protein